MGRALAVRGDYTSGAVRQLAGRAKDAAQARRLLAIAAVLDGASREEAASSCLRLVAAFYWLSMVWRGTRRWQRTHGYDSHSHAQIRSRPMPLS